MLTAIQIVYVFIALQLESNSTGTVLSWTDESPGDPWVFPFSLAAAIGSIATALGFGVLLWQSMLTRKQISLTQQEIETTLRPLLGHTSCELKTIPFKGAYKLAAILDFKNSGRLPASVIRQVQLWTQTEIKEEDLTNQPNTIPPPITIFPDQTITSYPFVNEQPEIAMEIGSKFYFGFILWYDFQVGQRRKEGKYGIILKCKASSGGLFDWSLITVIAG